MLRGKGHWKGQPYWQGNSYFLEFENSEIEAAENHNCLAHLVIDPIVPITRQALGIKKHRTVKATYQSQCR